MDTRRGLISALAVTTAFLSCAFEARGQATDWKQIIIPPLHAFHPQAPRRVALPNGMVIFLEEDHELPLVQGIARIRGGPGGEPPGGAGERGVGKEGRLRWAPDQ